LEVDTAVEAESVRLKAAGSICIVMGGRTRDGLREATRKTLDLHQNEEMAIPFLAWKSVV
jgi:hypothetical protein